MKGSAIPQFYPVVFHRSVDRVKEVYPDLSDLTERYFKLLLIVDLIIRNTPKSRAGEKYLTSKDLEDVASFLGSKSDNGRDILRVFRRKGLIEPITGRQYGKPSRYALTNKGLSVIVAIKTNTASQVQSAVHRAKKLSGY